MDGANSLLFRGFKQKLAWLSQRQRVLAENIANADTPDYRPNDLKPMVFQSLLKASSDRVQPALTDPRHLASGSTADGRFRETEMQGTFETAPAGNAVVIEEQMSKVNESILSHRITTELYKKHLNMLKLAVGHRG